jgi:hypothetical protein
MRNEIDYLKYLDEFLIFLRDSHQAKRHYDQLYKTFVGKEYTAQDSNIDSIPAEAFGTPRGENDLITIDWSQSDKYKENIFNSACNYLKELDLITTLPTSEITLTFKGHIKTANTFVDEYNAELERKSVSRWQKIGVWVAIGFSICSLGWSSYSYFYPLPSEEIHKTYNKSYKTYNYCEQHQPSVKSNSRTDKDF